MKLKALYQQWNTETKHNLEQTKALMMQLFAALKEAYASPNLHHWHHRLISIILSIVVSLVVFVVGVVFVFRYDPLLVNKFDLIFGIVMVVIGFCCCLAFIFLLGRYQILMRKKFDVLHWIGNAEVCLHNDKAIEHADKRLNQMILINGMMGVEWFLQLDRRTWIKLFRVYNNLASTL